MGSSLLLCCTEAGESTVCWDVFICRTYLGHNCLIEEKLFLINVYEDVLEEVEKFCFLGDMISCFGEASEALSGKIDTVWKKCNEFSGVLVREKSLYLKQRGRFASIVLDQFCCTVVKHGNLLWQVKRDCVGWSIK